MKARGLFVALMALMCSPTTNAEEVEIDGLWYELVSRAKEAKVIKPHSTASSGDIIIPATIEYDGDTYSVTSIRERAFEGRRLTSITIPNSVMSIGEYAFSRCSSLTSVTIPNSVTSVEEGVFEGCSGLTSVTIGNGVTSIGNNTFRNCSGLTSVTIPNSVTSIGVGIFEGCSALASVTIGNGVTNIGDGTFCYCCNLTSVTIGNSVTRIGVSAFFSCSSLTSVTIPSSVTSIENYAFSWCKSLTSITIPNSMTDIGKNAFSNCSVLSSVTIPHSVKNIGEYAFSDCRSLTTITIPNSVANIGEGLFSGCSNLSSVTIPNSVTSIGNNTFRYCSGLTSVTIGNSVTSIGSSAFYGCSNMTSVIIPSSVTCIGEFAFNSCIGLTSVTIGSDVRTIGSQAFAKCSELADVYCYAKNIPTTYTDAFEDSYINHSYLHVPASAINSYKITEPWSGFGIIVKIEGDEPEEKVCAKPTIHYQNGKLTFKCETEGVEFISEITDSDIKKSYTAEVDLNVTYHISVYATKEGYTNSETATATLCWIDVDPQKEGITEGDEDAVTEVKAMPVLIQSDGGELMVGGAKAGTAISIYDLSGRLITTTKAKEMKTRIEVGSGNEVVIVKVGEKTVKVRR